jgi:hypothetical protein
MKVTLPAKCVSFDHRKAKPNRFAKRTRPESIAVLLDPDVAQVFETGDTVNAVLGLR